MSSHIITSNSDLFYKYLDSCKGEVKSKSTDGYYHVDVVAEAYNKGYSDGKDKGETEFIERIISNEVDSFTQKANQIYILSKKIISTLKNEKTPADGLYISLKANRFSVIISTTSEQLNNDDFVNIAYAKIFEYKKLFNHLFNEHLDIGMISSDDLDEVLLKEDGFGYHEKY